MFAALGAVEDYPDFEVLEVLEAVGDAGADVEDVAGGAGEALLAADELAAAFGDDVDLVLLVGCCSSAPMGA